MVLELINDYLMHFLNLEQNTIFQGYQNCVALPENNENFCILSISDINRHGSNVESFDSNNATIKKLVGYTIDVDFIGDNEIKERELASKLETLSWSEVIRQWFKDNEASMLYASKVQDVPYVDEDSHYVHRYRVTLEISMWEEIQVDAQTAKEVSIDISQHGEKSNDPNKPDNPNYYKDGIENIDAEHKGG